MSLNYEQTVSDVIAGKYGNGAARRTALTDLGYDYPTVQTAVNTRLKGGDWLSTLPQATTASTTTPWYSGTNVPTVSGALGINGFRWNMPNELGISYTPMYPRNNTSNQINTPLTYESGLRNLSSFNHPTDDVYSNLSGYGISDGVAKAYGQSPRLGAITEETMNLFNKTKAGVMNSGRNVKSAFDGMDSFQKIGQVASGVKGLWDAYNGYKNNKMINRQLNFSMDMANRQYEANRKRINSQLEDRQARRHAERPDAHQSVSEYMKKYGV